MSLIGRTTEDYSPLRGPIINTHTGRDIRPRWERQKYEEAVNARREMLSVFDTMPAQKLSKKEYERLRRVGSQNSGEARRALKGMLHPIPLSAFEEA